jgi:hypothetical protein
MSIKTIYIYVNSNRELGLILDVPQEPNIIDYIDSEADSATTIDWVQAVRTYNESLEALKGTAIPIHNRDFVLRLIREETRVIEPDTFYTVYCMDYEVMEIRDIKEDCNCWTGGYKKIAVINEEEIREEQTVSVTRSRSR